MWVKMSLFSFQTANFSTTTKIQHELEHCEEIKRVSEDFKIFKDLVKTIE